MQEVAGGDEIRGQARNRRVLNTRRAILDAASVEFAAKGFAGASMRSVARSLGIEISHIQYHYGDKASLWSAVLSEVLGTQASESERIFAEFEGKDPDHTISAVVRRLVHYAASNPLFMAIMSQARLSREAEEAQAFRAQLANGSEKIIELIRHAQSLGRFVPGSPALLFYQLVGAALRIYAVAADAESLMGVGPDDPGVMDEHLETCLTLFMPNSPYTRHSGQRTTELDGFVLQCDLSRKRNSSSPPLVYLIEEASDLLRKYMNEMLREVCLTRNQLMVLVQIEAEQASFCARIARTLGVTPQSVTKLVRTLEDRGLVERSRSPQSRREHSLRLTTSGQRMLDRLRADIGRIDHTASHVLSDEDRFRLEEIVRQIRGIPTPAVRS